MQQTVYNPQKGRLETINIEFTDENTTWFDEGEDSHGILSITDLQAGILLSRAEIGHAHGKARALHRQYIAR